MNEQDYERGTKEIKDLKKLPDAIQRKLDHFIYNEIPNTKFFKPDGKPKGEWKMFYGDTWAAAWDAATKRLEAALSAKIEVCTNPKCHMPIAKALGEAMPF